MRYGDTPILSGEGWTEADLYQAYWKYRRSAWDQKILFPETAIRADLTRQNCHCFTRRLYVDIARRCRKCRRWFLFFALEQKYWYETLGFHIDADCLDCQECRHEQHVSNQMIERYQALLSKRDKSREEWQTLSELGDALYEIGYIKKPGTLQRTRMPKRLRSTL